MGACDHELAGRRSGAPRYCAAFPPLRDLGPVTAPHISGGDLIAIPDAPEVHIVLTNAMWHLALLQALLAFSVPPFGWRGRVSDIILFVVGAVSGPFSILLVALSCGLPLDSRQRWTLLLLGLCPGVALVFCLAGSVRKCPGRPSASTCPLLRIVGGKFFLTV